MAGLRSTISIAGAVAAAGLMLALPVRAADYAPLTCAKANSEAQQAICASYGLGQLEARMATLFEWTTALVAMGQRGDIQDQQAAFLKQREACKANVGCLRDAYDARIRQLLAVMARIKEQGPF